MFSICIHHCGRCSKFPGKRYVDGEEDVFDIVDIELFFMIELDEMVLQLGYTCESEPLFYYYLRPLSSLDEGLHALACDEDVRCLATLVRSFKLIGVFIKHGYTTIDSYPRATPQRVREKIEECKEDIVQSTDNHVLGDIIRRITFDDMELDGEACFGNIEGRNLDSSGLIHDESFGVDDLDLNLDLNVDLNVPLLEIVQEVQYDVDGIKSGYDTQYDGDYSSEDAGTDDENDVMVDEENEIIEHDVEVNLFGITNNVPFDNIGVTSLLPKEVLEKEDVDVVNVDGFDSDEGCEDEVGFKRRKKLKELIRGMENRVLNGTARMKYTFYCRQICGNAKEVKERVYLHSIESKRN
ncbi:hypothetical protein Tco_0596129 [Tanacetum coccineum]